MSFHRIMKRPDNSLVMRLVPNRHTWEYYKRSGGKLEAAICIGADPAVLLAGAICTDLGKYELAIASALAGKPVETVRCKRVGLSVPADTEIVIEARLTPELVDEGPFVDITLTPDIVRKEPKAEVLAVTHRQDPVFHALLPGGYEHATVWKTPTEAVMLREIRKQCDCTDVFLSFGGCSRFHGIVQIRKKKPSDGRAAIDAAFGAHKSMKHVFIVDEDIDVQDPAAVEWALATRFQAKTDLVVRNDEHGSTLDPSTQKSGRTSKAGFDCTIKGDPKEFRKVF